MSDRTRGVDQDLGDRCSAIAYGWAKSTFGARGPDAAAYDGASAHVVRIHGNLLAISSDGVGTKVEIAERVGRYDTLGYDLLAMVVDDLAAIGAEPVAVSNILDVDRLEESTVDALMSGLARAAIESRVVISGGEIAQLGDRISGYGAGMHFNWAATGIGLLPGCDDATGGGWRDRLSAGDRVIALASDGFRSNGFTLARQILESVHGGDWHNAATRSGRRWGEALLVPSRLYAHGVVALIERGIIRLHGAVHVTGGGVPGNLARLLTGTGLGADLEALWLPHDEMLELVELGGVDPRRAFDQWNMGNGMLLVLAEDDADRAVEQLERAGYQARLAGGIDTSERIAIDATPCGLGHLSFALEGDR